MNSIVYSKTKIFLCILLIFLIWQALKYFPSVPSLKKLDNDYGTDSLIVTPPVLVSVFYEALCPDSKNFIVRHLLPAVNKASHLIDVSLIPYGKARTEEAQNGSLSFSCQHGPVECLANKIHACSIAQISNPSLLIKYISCMITDNMIPEIVAEKCGNEYEIEWQSILQCANSEKGSSLLKTHGKSTDSLKPQMTFVPTVLLNNKHRNQATILKDFFKEVCLILNNFPQECSAQA